MKTALSFGGGRQTVGIVVLMATGQLPKCDLVAFADPGWEYPETYDYNIRYIKPILDEINIPFVVVKGSAAIPHSTERCDNLYDYYWHRNFVPSPISRDCTDHFKIRPLKKLYKEWGIEQIWIGFSLDEAHRTNKPYLGFDNRAYPLIDKRLTVSDCEYEIQHYGLPVPLKSSCIFCSFQTPWRARQLYERHPDLFEKVGQLEDNALRKGDLIG